MLVVSLDFLCVYHTQFTLPTSTRLICSARQQQNNQLHGEHIRNARSIMMNHEKSEMRSRRWQRRWRSFMLVFFYFLLSPYSTRHDNLFPALLLSLSIPCVSLAISGREGNMLDVTITQRVFLRPSPLFFSCFSFSKRHQN